MRVQNVEGFEILLYLQANELAYHSLVDASRGHETPGSDKGLYSTGSCMSFMLVHQFPLLLKSRWRCLDGCHICHTSQLRNPVLKEP